MNVIAVPDSAERMVSVSSGNALELRGVTKMFGALAAISDITIDGRFRRAPRRAWLKRCRQDHAV
jgi:branched-chain amino acid transport system ATP-binding protein